MLQPDARNQHEKMKPRCVCVRLPQRLGHVLKTSQVRFAALPTNSPLQSSMEPIWDPQKAKGDSAQPAVSSCKLFGVQCLSAGEYGSRFRPSVSIFSHRSVNTAVFCRAQLSWDRGSQPNPPVWPMSLWDKCLPPKPPFGARNQPPCWTTSEDLQGSRP